MEAFLQCSQAPRPDNTLFPSVSSYDIGYGEMESYEELIMGLFRLNPEGHLDYTYTCMHVCQNLRRNYHPPTHACLRTPGL